MQGINGSNIEDMLQGIDPQNSKTAIELSIIGLLNSMANSQLALFNSLPKNNSCIENNSGNNNTAIFAEITEKLASLEAWKNALIIPNNSSDNNTAILSEITEKLASLEAWKNALIISNNSSDNNTAILAEIAEKLASLEAWKNALIIPNETVTSQNTNSLELIAGITYYANGDGYTNVFYRKEGFSSNLVVWIWGGYFVVGIDGVPCSPLYDSSYLAIPFAGSDMPYPEQTYSLGLHSNLFAYYKCGKNVATPPTGPVTFLVIKYK